MLKLRRWLLNWDRMGVTRKIVPITVGMALVSATIAPVSAQQVIVIDSGNLFGVNQPPAAASFIYGSPIPTPVPVNPVTGRFPSNSSYYPGSSVVNFRRLNPVLVNPTIQNSTLINPVIINQQRGYSRRGVYWRSPSIYYPN